MRLSAFVVWAALAAVAPTMRIAAQQAPADQEVGTAHWGSTYVWLRATGAGLVQVYASTGYRSAFTQPVALSPDDAERWAALLDRLADPDSATSLPTGLPQASDGETARMVLASGDLVLEFARGSASEPQVRAWVGADRSDAVVAVIGLSGAGQGATLLRTAARAARSLHEAAIASAASNPSPPALQATGVSTAAVTAPSPTAPSPRAGARIAPAVASAAPTPVLSPSVARPGAQLVSVRSTTTIDFVSPRVHVPRPAHAQASALPALKTTTRLAPLHVAAPALATVTTVNAAPQQGVARGHPGAASPAHAGTPSVAHAASHAASSVSGDGPQGVDDATVQNLVGQWRPELMYCYTQYGLREHADLAGRLAVRVALSPSGTVGHSVIGSHAWNGDGGSDVESCIRARVAAWHFPPASTGSIHTFNLEFAPGRS